MLPYYVVAPILIAVFLFVFSGVKAVKVLSIIAQTILVGFAGYLFFLCKDGDIITNVGGYDSVLGITLRADTLSSVFVVLTTFAFLMAAIYSFGEDSGKLFWFLLFIWQGLLLGIFLTRDLFNIFVLVEVATVVVSVLIMFNRDNRSMYDGMFYLMASIVAMQFYLFGVGYIYKLTGVLDMEAAAVILRELDTSSLILPYALIITAISLKCALLPLFSWLPKAHGTPGAPTAVSALLSGVYIKGGVYLLIRTQVLFQGVDASLFFLVVGIITGIAGFVLAISQTDIKLILAYHTISQVGMIITGLSIGGEYAYTGALYHAVNHALFKSALFLSAGIIIKAYGTRNIYEIHSVFKRYPLVGVATVMAILGITGAPLFNGSISKYFIMYDTGWAVSAALTFINLGTIISFIKYSTMLFSRGDAAVSDEVVVSGKASGEASDSAPSIASAKPVPAPIYRQTVILILGSVCFIGGIFGEEFIRFLFNVRLSVDAAGYLEKTAFFAASLLSGYFIYKYFVQKSTLFSRLRELDIGFRGTCVSIGIFFAAVLVFLGFL